MPHTYYVDSRALPGGSGLSAESAACSWRELTILPGDSILFARGSFFRDVLELPEGTAEAPLYIGAYKYIESSGNRFQGIQKAFEEKGIHVSEAMFIEMEPKSNYVESVLQKILTDKIPFDSIIAFSDLIAFEIISRFKSHPIVSTVPVVGFDAINAHLYCPGVSISVGMTDGGWADKASSILYQKMNGSKEKFHEIIDVKLFEFK